MLDARARTIRDILHSGDQYLIPFFQRSYSWEQKHWQRLLDDVDALGETSADRLHFLGPLVCAPMPHVPSEVPSYQLIDGQQRLTTISLMLCALRELARSQGASDLADEIEEDYLLHKRRKGLSRFKVVPRIGDREVLIAALDGQSLEAWPDAGVTKCLRYFVRAFGKRCAHPTEQVLPRLFRDITARMALVVITVTGENPYEIFETLNSTGLPLDQSDLVRNFLFMGVKLEQQQDFYDEHWRPFEQMFAATRDDPAIDQTAFYRDYLLREGVYVPARDTYVDFREQSSRRNLAPETLVTELKRYLRFGIWINRPHTCDNARVRRCLLEFASLDAATANPLVFVLLARLDESAISIEAFEAAMRDFASFLIRRSVSGYSTRAYGRWFTEAIGRIEAEPVEDLRQYWQERGWPGDVEFGQRILDFPIYRRESVKCRLILERLEESYGHKEKVDPLTLTIEHVLPQTLDDTAAGRSWKEALGDKWFEEHQQWVHVLGNLTLSGYNPEMSNNSYDVKRQALVSSNLVLNAYFKERETWNATDIQERGGALAKQVARLWPNPRQERGKESTERGTRQAKTSNFDVELLRQQSLSRIERVLGQKMVQQGEARYASADGSVHVLCVASQPYRNPGGLGYWFGVTPMQISFLGETGAAHVALCCGSPDRIVWIPREPFLDYVRNMDETRGKHWHVHVYSGEGLMLGQPNASPNRADVRQYLLSAE